MRLLRLTLIVRRELDIVEDDLVVVCGPVSAWMSCIYHRCEEGGHRTKGPLTAETACTAE